MDLRFRDQGKVLGLGLRVHGVEFRVWIAKSGRITSVLT